MRFSTVPEVFQAGYKAIPRVNVAFLDNLPVVGDLFNNWCVTEWFAIVLIILLQFFFYKTVWGLRLRAVGQFPGSGEDGRYQSKCCEISGNAAFRSHRRSGRCSSFPGLQYPVYREHDQQPWFYGRCSHVFRRCQPGSDHTGLSAVWIFRFRRCRLQAYGIPSQFVLMMPYIVTIAVLAISMIAKISANKKRESSLHVGS